MSKYTPQIHKDHPNIPKTQIDRIIRSYHEKLEDDLIETGRAYLYGLCALHVRPRKITGANLPNLKAMGYVHQPALTLRVNTLARMQGKLDEKLKKEQGE